MNGYRVAEAGGPSGDRVRSRVNSTAALRRFGLDVVVPIVRACGGRMSVDAIHKAIGATGHSVKGCVTDGYSVHSLGDILYVMQKTFHIYTDPKKIRYVVMYDTQPLRTWVRVFPEIRANQL